MSLKLGPLPDRETTKISFTASPALRAALADYAEIYRQTYGRDESISDLIPFMLEGFMAADTGFKRARKALAAPEDTPREATEQIEQTQEDD